MKQKDAVFQVVTSLVEVNGPVNLNADQKKLCVDAMVEMFQKNEIELISPQDDLKRYASGLLNNWMRKDPRLNGGVKYEAKNPGSRAGQSDPVIKCLKAMLSQPDMTDEKRAVIQKEIDALILEKKVDKVKKVIDLSVIPDDLKARLGL